MRDMILIVNDKDRYSGVDAFDIQELAVQTIPGCDFTDDFDSEEDVDDRTEEFLSRAEEKGIIRRTGGKYGFAFAENGAAKYFGNRLELLKTAVDKLTNEEFVTDADRITFRIGQLLENKFDKYVYVVPHEELIPLDDFIREYAGNMKYINRENKFILENIVFYHY